MKISRFVFDFVKTLTEEEFDRLPEIWTRTGQQERENMLLQVGRWRRAHRLEDVRSPETQNLQQLYDALLEAQRYFSDFGSVDARLAQMIADAEMLTDRGLLEQALELLDEAAEMSRRYERYAALARVGMMRITLAIKTWQGDIKVIERKIDSIWHELKTALDQFLITEDYRMHSLRLLLLNRQEAMIQSNIGQQQYARIITHPSLAASPPINSPRAYLYYTQAHLIYRIATRNLKEAFRTGQQLVQHFEMYPDLIGERPDNYLAVIQNQISMATHTEPLYLLRELLEKYRNVPARFPNIAFSSGAISEMPLFTYDMELRYLVQKGKFKEADAVVGKLLNIIDQVEFENINLNKGYRYLSVFSNLGIYYLYQKEPAHAILYTDRLLNHPALTDDYELKMESMLLKVVALIDLDREQELKHTLKQLYRSLLRKAEPLEHQKYLLDLIRKSAKKEVSEGQLMEELAGEIKKWKASSGQPVGLLSFDLVTWAENHAHRLYNQGK